MGVQDYDTTAGNNTAISGIAISGSSSIKNGDNALRQLMADTATGIRNSSYMAAGYITKATGYTVVAADRGKIIDCTAALTLSLTAAATVGQGFVFIVKANGGDVTVDPNGTENINGASTSLVVANGSFAIIACTGAAWHSLVSFGLASDIEAQAGTSTTKVLTPANLQAVTATEIRKGVVELATTVETTTGTDTARAVTPAGFLAALRGNIRGTVSQSGGVPTGAIIERGSNANGEYVRYADGTQICWNHSIAEQSVTTATGSVFRTTTAATWTFPVPFASPPTVTINAAGLTRWGSCSSPNSASCDVSQLSGATSAATTTTSGTAIGRWF